MGPSHNFFINAVQKHHALHLFKGGIEACRTVRGLKRRYLLGMAIGFTLTAIFFYFLLQLLYAPFFTESLWPYTLTWVDRASWFAWGFKAIYYLASFVALALMVYISLQVTNLFMGVWVDFLIERIIRHFRELPEQGWSFKRCLEILLKQLKPMIIAILFTAFFFVLGFIPFIGPILAFIGLSRNIGQDLISPYQMILAEYREGAGAEHVFKSKYLCKNGFLMAMIIAIPFIGWLLVPMFRNLQILGFCYSVEKQWKIYNSKQLLEKENDTSSKLENDEDFKLNLDKIENDLRFKES